MYSFGRLTAPEAPNAAQVEQQQVVDLQAADERTLIFTLAKPIATFLEFLADSNLLWVMPTESESGFDPATKMIGTGPWIFDSYQPSVALKWDRNPNWHFDGVDGESLPYLDH